MAERPPAAVLAVDLGGTWLRAAQVTAEGRLLERLTVRTPEAGRPAAVVAAIRELVERLEPLGARTDLVGVAAPGPLDPATGVVYQPPNLADWGAFGLGAALETALGRRVWVQNDANLAALGEASLGAGRGISTLVYLTVSTGVGGGIIVGGRIFEGAHGLAGELGHVVVDAGAPARCNAGHTGCLEALASGTAIARQAAERTGPGVALTARDVAGLARLGNDWALALFAEAGRYLGLALGGISNVLDPGRIVLGGGMTASWDLFAAPMDAALRSVAMAAEARPIEVVRAELGDDAGLVGAALYALARRDAAI